MANTFDDYFLPNVYDIANYIHDKDLKDKPEGAFSDRTLVMFNFDETKHGMVDELSALCNKVKIKVLTYTYPKNLTEKDLEDIMDLLNFTQENIASGVVFINMNEQTKFLLDYLEPKQDVAALTSMSKYISPMAKGIIEYFDNSSEEKLYSLTTVYVNIYDRHCADLIDILHERGCPIVWEDDEVAYDRLIRGCDIIITDHADIAQEYKNTAEVVLDYKNIKECTMIGLLKNLVYERDRL